MCQEIDIVKEVSSHATGKLLYLDLFPFQTHGIVKDWGGLRIVK